MELFELPAPSSGVLVRVGPYLDFRNVIRVKCKCMEEIKAGHRRFVFDLTDTVVLDSTGVDLLFSIYRRLAPGDGRVLLTGAQGSVAVMLQLARADKVFGTCTGLREAVAALAI